MPSVIGADPLSTKLDHLVGCGATNILQGNCGSPLGWLCDRCRLLKRILPVVDAADDSWSYMASDWSDGMPDDIQKDKDAVALRLGESLAALEEAI